MGSELHAVWGASLWIIVLFAHGFNSLAFVELIEPRSENYHRAECCSQLAVVVSIPPSRWSPEDGSDFKNLSKCCDVSGRVTEPKCSSPANSSERFSHTEVGESSESDCCLLLDALMQRPQSEWTSTEKENYEKWSECCSQGLMSEKDVEPRTHSPAMTDCCPSLKALKCRSTSADDRSLDDNRQRSHDAWLDCCLENLQPEEGEFTSSFNSRALPRCCTAVKNLFIKSMKQFISPDEKEDFATGKARLDPLL